MMGGPDNRWQCFFLIHVWKFCWLPGPPPSSAIRAPPSSWGPRRPARDTLDPRPPPTTTHGRHPPPPPKPTTNHHSHRTSPTSHGRPQPTITHAHQPPLQCHATMSSSHVSRAGAAMKKSNVGAILKKSCVGAIKKKPCVGAVVMKICAGAVVKKSCGYEPEPARHLL